MKELLEYIVTSLVGKPEEVEIREEEKDQTLLLEVRVAKEDLGRIIGKQGRTAKSIRNIIQAASIRANKRAILEILEE